MYSAHTYSYVLDIPYFALVEVGCLHDVLNVILQDHTEQELPPLLDILILLRHIVQLH